MKVSVTDQCAVLVQEEKLVQNSENIYTVEFVFDESWNSFIKTAIFSVGSSNIAVLLTESRCVIPSQCLKRAGANIQIGIYGVRGDERKPTIWCKTSSILPGTGTGQIVTPPSPDIYSQILGSVGDISELQTEGKSLVEAINELKKAIANIDSSGGDSSSEETATDDEVDDILNDVFGE